MPQLQRHQQGVRLAVAGWIVQTAGAAGLLVEWWQYDAAIALAPGVAIPFPLTLVLIAVAVTLAGTILLGIGLGMIAGAKGHHPLFGLLAPTWLVSLLLIALLPDMLPNEREGRLRFECPHCGAVTLIEVAHAGKQGDCRVCGEQVKVPPLLTKSDRTDPAPQINDA